LFSSVEFCTAPCEVLLPGLNVCRVKTDVIVNVCEDDAEACINAPSCGQAVPESKIDQTTGQLRQPLLSPSMIIL
jgi:hypothetical protein